MTFCVPLFYSFSILWYLSFFAITRWSEVAARLFRVNVVRRWLYRSSLPTSNRRLAIVSHTKFQSREDFLGHSDSKSKRRTVLKGKWLLIDIDLVRNLFEVLSKVVLIVYIGVAAPNSAYLLHLHRNPRVRRFFAIALPISCHNCVLVAATMRFAV